MSSDKVNLGDISDKLNVNLSRNIRKNSNYKFFPSKNNRDPTEQDKSAVSSYSSILGGIVKKGANAVAGLFQNNNKVVKTSLGQRRPIRTVKEGGHSKSTSQPLKTNHQLSNNKETLLRCNVCNCVNPCNIEGCTFCMKEEIQIIDSDCEEFPSIEHTQRKPRMSNGQIPTASFYSKENTSFGNHSSSKLNASRSNISITDDDTEESVKYEIDYLYIGTYRFISRTYIRVASDKLVLFINSGKEGLNIDYKLVRNIFICEAKSDNSKYTYMKIDFCSEAVDAINAYISKFNDENGNFKFESIVGHEKYFIMKLKFLLPEEALKLKKRLRIYLQHKLREELSIHSMFEQQRHYCLNLRSRKMCRTAVRRTNDQDKLSTSEIKSALRNRLRDEPMEVDRIHRNVPSMTTRSLSQLFSVSDRSTVSANERTQLKWKRPHKKLKFFKRPIICRTKRLVNCEQTTSTVQPTKNVTDTIEEKIINKSKVDSSIKSEENTNLISSNTSTQAVCARCSDCACNNQQVQIPNSNHNPIQLNRTSTIKISIINNTNSSLIGSMSMPATVGTDASLSVTPEITLKLMVVDETNGN